MRRALTALLLIPLLAVVGCEREQRVPYIPPKLGSWPATYRGVPGVSIEAFVTGWLQVPAALLDRGAGLAGTRSLPVLAFAVHHPTQGIVLFGTGLSRDFSQGRPLGGLTGWLVAAAAFEGQDLPAQLHAGGVAPQDVRMVVLSTMRFDQTGELEAFPDARVVVARSEHQYALASPIAYRQSEYDEVASWRFIDFALDAPLGTFPSHVDLFGDGSCLVLDAAGYTPGTMAMLVRLPSAPVLLAGALAAEERSIRFAARPPFAYDTDTWWDRIWRLKRFGDLDPNLRILPAYDVGPIWRLTVAGIVLHAATPASGAPR